jgi:hypothetical protein
MGGQRLRESVGRTILVIEEQPYLWAVLRGRVQPGTAYVRSVSPSELVSAWATCQPWPWLLVGATPGPPDRLAALLEARPIAVHWLGGTRTLTGRVVVHDDWGSLAAELEGLNELTSVGLGGVRLMRNRGLLLPSGRVVGNVVNVEGLLSARTGLALASNLEADRLAERVQAEITNHGLPLSLSRRARMLCLTPARSNSPGEVARRAREGGARYPDPHAGTSAGADPGGRPGPG